jgi:hypothetical protein
VTGQRLPAAGDRFLNLPPDDFLSYSKVST